MAGLIVRPDADPETSTFDGDLWFEGAGDETWLTVRGAAAATTISDAGSALVVYLLAGNAPNTFNSLGRIEFGFLTSAIPDDATIDAVALQVHTRSAAFDDLVQSLNVTTKTAPASPTAASVNDYAVAGFGNTKLSDTDLAIATVVDDTQYTFTFNAAGRAAINKTGVTWLALRIVSDIDNAAPVHAGGFIQSDFTIHSAEAVSEAHRPVLVITYTPAGAGGLLPSHAVTIQVPPCSIPGL